MAFIFLLIKLIIMTQVLTAFPYIFSWINFIYIVITFTAQKHQQIKNKTEKSIDMYQ